MTELRYSKTHEWCSLAGDMATCGISKHAAEELNDLTFLEFRVEAGAGVAREQTYGEVDSVKATSELYAPVSGTVSEINERFKSEDELPAITSDPEGAGWLIKIKVSDPGEFQELMDAQAYAAFCAQDDH